MTSVPSPVVEFNATLITRGGGAGAKRIMDQNPERGDFIRRFTGWERVEAGMLTLDRSQPLPLPSLAAVEPLAVESVGLLKHLHGSDAFIAEKRGLPSYYGAIATARGRQRLVVLSQQPHPAVEHRLEVVADVRLRDVLKLDDGDKMTLAVYQRLNWLRLCVPPRSWFEEWRGPRAFFLKADNCMGLFEPDEILKMSGVQHIFDAFVAGLFGRIWNDHRPFQVRLVGDEFPDAQLRDAAECLDLEITLVDKNGRRMAEEHRAWREMQERGEVSALPIDRDQDRAHALEAVPRRCAEKVQHYLGSESADGQVPAHLLLYLNFTTLFGPVISDAEIMRLTKPWRRNFRSIWLLSGARIIRAWTNHM